MGQGSLLELEKSLEDLEELTDGSGGYRMKT